MIDLAYVRARRAAAADKVVMLHDPLNGGCRYLANAVGPLEPFIACDTEADTLFLAMAYDVVPALCDEVEELRRKLALVEARTAVPVVSVNEVVIGVPSGLP